MSKVHNRAVVWFRNDLRIHDNEALKEALMNAQEIIPVYVFDERIFKGKTKYGFAKTSKYRAKFILESVADLQKSLKELSIDLVIRIGKPEEEIFTIAHQTKSSWVFCNRERTKEEVFVQDQLEQKLWTIGQEIRYSRGKMLYYTSDLPFPITQTPNTFTQYRKEVEKIITIRKPIATITSSFPPLTVLLDYGKLPSLEDLGHQDFGANDKGGYEWKGGETEGLKQLHYYLWETDLITKYKKTRNQLLGRDFSTKFSPWLSIGALSPKLIYHEIKKYEQEKTANNSTYWVYFELLWRDFFRLIGKKYGNKIFLESGIKEVSNTSWSDDYEALNKWTKGETGIPFIDANMQELNATGWMSNRGRQVVASYLINDLKVNWVMGAEYFESMLLDYDPCSNYLNWGYIAGVGNDSREDRYFNVALQASKHDPKAEYVKYWLPQFKDHSTEEILKMNEF